VAIDLAALALTLVWLQRRLARGRLIVPLVLAASAVLVALSLRGSAPGANTLSVLLARGLKELNRDQTSLWPLSFSQMLNAGALLAAGSALFGGGGELGLVFAACLAARGALDVPI